MGKLRHSWWVTEQRFHPVIQPLSAIPSLGSRFVSSQKHLKLVIRDFNLGHWHIPPDGQDLDKMGIWTGRDQAWTLEVDNLSSTLALVKFFVSSQMSLIIVSIIIIKIWFTYHNSHSSMFFSKFTKLCNNYHSPMIICWLLWITRLRTFTFKFLCGPPPPRHNSEMHETGRHFLPFPKSMTLLRRIFWVTVNPAWMSPGPPPHPAKGLAVMVSHFPDHALPFLKNLRCLPLHKDENAYMTQPVWH